MAEGKDIAYMQIAYIAGAAIGGILLGTFVIAPAWKKFQDKRAAKSTKRPDSSLKK